MGSLFSKRRRSSTAENGKERKDSGTVSNGFAGNNEEPAGPQLPAPVTAMPGLTICLYYKNWSVSEEIIIIAELFKTQSQSYEVSLDIWDHTVLPVNRHK